MRYRCSIAHFDLERLIEVRFHETQHIHLVCEELIRRLRSSEIKVEETVGFAAIQELVNLSRVFGFQTSKVDILKRRNANLGSIQIK